MSHVELTLIGKPDCHLCDVAKDVIGTVVDELRTTESAPSVTVKQLSILDNPELHERYWEQIPVLLVNGAKHSKWHIDPAQLRATILKG